ncbi:RICIN domain-containing protein [Reinekea sp. G2M2-21]|uniref:RICIN domain-containing protein n=1 Tax=Reinekea sp. G2M2-21 TaxID=2788942 RepID=UPI0018AA5D2E|nr:RICIN domain-containing protein [Reinekea sp. G2M2-21]
MLKKNTLNKIKQQSIVTLACLWLTACQVETLNEPDATPVSDQSLAKASLTEVGATSMCNAVPISGGLYTLVNRQSGLALDVYRKETEAGTAIIQWRPTGAANQTFKVTRVDGNYWNIEATHSGMSLDVLGFADYDNAAIVQWPYLSGPNQQWHLVKSSSGGFSVRARHSGKALTASSDQIGAAVVQKQEQGEGLQRWYFNPTNGFCQDAVGFANEPGSDGLQSTTGGAAGSMIVAETCDQLKNALTNDSALTVFIPDTTLDCRTQPRKIQACEISCPSYREPEKTFYRVPVGNQTCTELGSNTNATVTQPRYDIRINVKSNKTLVGLGANSRLLGVSLNLSGQKNIIVSNLSIEEINPHLVEAGDAISADNASHIWIDHVKTKRISDGHLDARSSQNMTLSWNHFDGFNGYVCGRQHHYTLLLQDSQATLHHNYFDHVSGRNPKLVGDKTRVHLFNNYWKNVTYFAISTANRAEALIENNVFENSRRPHWNESGYMNALGNIYTGISATDPERDSGNAVFGDVNLYSYRLDDPATLPDSVATQAGPR